MIKKKAKAIETVVHGMSQKSFTQVGLLTDH